MFLDIKRERAGLERPAVDAARVAFRAAPAHVNANACDELADAERFHDVVICAELEATNPVILPTSRGEDEDRYVRAASKLAEQVESIRMPQHQIEKDRVRLLPLENLERGWWILGRERSEACLFHDRREKLQQLALIVDDQKLCSQIS